MYFVKFDVFGQYLNNMWSMFVQQVSVQVYMSPILGVGIFDSQKMTFAIFFDMYFIKLMVLGQYLVSVPLPPSKEGDQYRFTRKTVPSESEHAQMDTMSRGEDDQHKWHYK